MAQTILDPLTGNRVPLDSLRRQQAMLHGDDVFQPDLNPFERVLARAEEIERKWPVQGDPGDEYTYAEPLDQAKIGPGVLVELCGPFGRKPVTIEASYRVTDAPRSAEDIHD
jgi:hypothetical protein